MFNNAELAGKSETPTFRQAVGQMHRFLVMAFLSKNIDHSFLPTPQSSKINN